MNIKLGNQAGLGFLHMLVLTTVLSAAAQYGIKELSPETIIAPTPNGIQPLSTGEPAVAEFRRTIEQTKRLAFSVRALPIDLTPDEMTELVKIIKSLDAGEERKACNDAAAFKKDDLFRTAYNLTDEPP
jgi:hypothetical protein